MNITPIILAAGKGTRMYSNLPKVLHEVGGKPMVKHVISTCRKISNTNPVIVYGYGGDKVKALFADDNEINWAFQKEQKGTGHAVKIAEEFIGDDDKVIIAYGDVPLITASTLKALADSLDGHVLSVLTTKLKDPTGYGRIIRNKNTGELLGIVEHKDATPEQLEITEGNTGFVAANGKALKGWLKQLSPENAQGEYYLTDCVALAVKEDAKVTSVVCDDEVEVLGVNDRKQQAILERKYQKNQADSLMEQGVTIFDPSRIDIRGNVTVGKDVSIDVNAVFIGNVTLGDSVTIDSGVVITDSQIGDNSHIKANSVIESAKIGSHCDVGPFARVRPLADLRDNVKIGNFVEIKKSLLNEGSKVSHLSYIGDTVMGKNVNIGAGTITCNYDGVNKFQTTIGNDVFVGSDTQLIAPVTVEDGATIGAGSTITKDSPANELTLSRAKQLTIKGWQRPKKIKK